MRARKSVVADAISFNLRVVGLGVQQQPAHHIMHGRHSANMVYKVGLGRQHGRVTVARASALPAHKVARRLGVQDLDPVAIGVCQPRQSRRV